MAVTEFEAVPAVERAARTPGLVVMKFGGTSVGDPEKLKRVARRLVAAQVSGSKVIAVVSAMGHTTDELVALAQQVSPSPQERELDMLL
jgi:aspartate kinase